MRACWQPVQSVNVPPLPLSLTPPGAVRIHYDVSTAGRLQIQRLVRAAYSGLVLYSCTVESTRCRNVEYFCVSRYNDVRRSTCLTAGVVRSQSHR